MPNTLLLPENFATYDFVVLAKNEPHPQNRLRLIAMGHIQDGNKLKVVALYVKVHWKFVQRWLANFRLGVLMRYMLRRPDINLKSLIMRLSIESKNFWKP